MSEIITFTPREREWDQNLADYVAAAKAQEMCRPPRRT